MSYEEMLYSEDSEIWNRLPRKVVDVPFLEEFKASSDRALRNLVLWETLLPMVVLGEME